MKLNSQQTLQLERIKRAKDEYDFKRDELEKAYQQRLSELREPIRVLVAEATESKVPVRQIHLAMGFGQVGQLLAFLKKDEGGTRGALEALLYDTVTVHSPVADSALETAGEDYEAPYKVLPADHPNNLRVVQPDGETVLLHMYHENQGHLILSPFKNESVPEGLREALIAYYPNAQTVGAMSEAGAIVNWLD